MKKVESFQGEVIIPPLREKALPPGSLILYVCDGTDGNENGGITNGVKRTQLNIVKSLEKKGYRVELLYPLKKSDQSPNKNLFTSTTLPGYEGFQVVTNPLPIIDFIKRLKPHTVFIHTLEGPLGMATSAICSNPELIGLSEPIPYVAAFTTRLDQFASMTINHWFENIGHNLPESLQASLLRIFSVEPEIFQPWLKGLYSGAERILVPTQTMREELEKVGLNMSKSVLWPRGIDQSEFRQPDPDEKNPYENYDWFLQNPKKIALYFGRVGVEKNIKSFLRSDFPDCYKVVIGDGPILEELKNEYPGVHFLGKKFGSELTELIRHADVHIFPSLTDTFGNTILEAGASGVPTIGFGNAAGPRDVLAQGVSGILIDDESQFYDAFEQALILDRSACRQDIINRYSWDRSSEILLDQLVPSPFISNDEGLKEDERFK